MVFEKVSTLSPLSVKKYEYQAINYVGYIPSKNSSNYARLEIIRSEEFDEDLYNYSVKVQIMDGNEEMEEEVALIHNINFKFQQTSDYYIADFMNDILFIRLRDDEMYGGNFICILLNTKTGYNRVFVGGAFFRHHYRYAASCEGKIYFISRKEEYPSKVPIIENKINEALDEEKIIQKFDMPYIAGCEGYHDPRKGVVFKVTTNKNCKLASFYDIKGNKFYEKRENRDEEIFVYDGYILKIHEKEIIVSGREIQFEKKIEFSFFPEFISFYYDSFELNLWVMNPNLHDLTRERYRMKLKFGPKKAIRAN